MVALSLFRGKEEGGGPIYKSEVDINDTPDPLTPKHIHMMYACISHNYSLMRSNCKKPKAWVKVVGSRSRKSCLRRRSRRLPARSPRALQPIQPLQRWVGRKTAGNTRDEDWTRCQDFWDRGPQTTSTPPAPRGQLQPATETYGNRTEARTKGPHLWWFS